MTTDDRTGAICVIGAGPAGLAMARALRRHGVEYEQVERHHDLGGLWDIDNPGTAMYESAHFISSRTLSGFHDYPMPADYPDYPSHAQILAYLRAFARTHDLDAGIRFGTEVVKVRKEPGSWLVATADGGQRRYRGVVCATGAQWHPYVPVLSGSFAGEVRHSSSYRSPEDLRGRRVLVVGAGNSGCDIVSDVGRVAERSYLSVRRGYWFIPKHIFGMPADVFGESGPTMPMWLEQRVFGALLRLLLGDLRRLGLPRPDHRLLESHPILNTEVLERLQHGDVIAKPDVARLDGAHVVFVDGSREQVDVVLLATGYRHAIPYAQQYFGDEQHPELYLSVFSREHRNLFGIGFLETNSGAFQLFDHAAHLVGAQLRQQQLDPARAARFERLIREHRPDLTGGLKLVDSPRHRGYVDSATLTRVFRSVEERMGWGPPGDGTGAPSAAGPAGAAVRGSG